MKFIFAELAKGVIGAIFNTSVRVEKSPESIMALQASW